LSTFGSCVQSRISHGRRRTMASTRRAAASADCNCISRSASLEATPKAPNSSAWRISGFSVPPNVAIITTDRELGTYGAIDCGAYVANFVLAARSLGVGAIAQAALAAYPTFWRERLRLGEERLVVCGISLGHEDPMHPANRFRTSRADVSQAARRVEE
jgi:nitroreductase